MSAFRSCPVCDGRQTRVYDSRPSADGSETTRRVRCVTCDSRWSTVEHFKRLIVIEGKRVSRARRPERPAEITTHSTGFALDNEP